MFIMLFLSCIEIAPIAWFANSILSVSSDLSIISDYDENATREIGESISRIGECFDYMDFINDDDNIQELDQDDITSPTSIVSMTLSDTIINKGAAIAVAIHFINTQI